MYYRLSIHNHSQSNQNLNPIQIQIQNDTDTLTYIMYPSKLNEYIPPFPRPEACTVCTLPSHLFEPWPWEKKNMETSWKAEKYPLVMTHIAMENHCLSR